MQITLASALGPHPLDRVQVNDKAEIAEQRAWRRMGYGDEELPFMYFQRVTSEGLLEVMGAPEGT